MMQNELAAIVTGGSSGIGFAVAKKLSEEGAKVIIADVNPPAKSLSNCFYVETDISKYEDIQKLFEQANSTTGLPEILVCNAGRGIHETLFEGDPEKWSDVVNINFIGTLRTIRAFTPAMLQRKSGHVVFISSVSASQKNTWGGVYSATKAAIEKIAATLRQELLPFVKVTVITPGVVASNFFNNMTGGGYSYEDIGYGALSPDDVADAVFFAVSRKPEVSVSAIEIHPIAQPV